MFRYLKKHKYQIFLIVLLAFGLGVLDVAKGTILQIIVDTSVGNLTYTFSSIITIIMIYCALSYLVQYVYQKMIYRIATNAVVDIKKDILNTLIQKENICMEHNMNILTIMNKDVEIVLDKYYLNIFSLIRMSTLFILALLYLLNLNVALTIIILSMGMFSVALPNFFVKTSAEKKSVYAKNCAEFNKVIKEILYGIDTIFLNGIETKYYEKSNKINIDYEKSREEMCVYDGFIKIISSCVSFLVLAANVVIAGYLAFKGVFSIGTVLAVMQVMNYILYPLSQGPFYFAEIKSVKEIVKKIQGILDEQNEVSLSSFEGTVDEIVFQDVSFKYKNASTYALKNLNIKIKSKQKYAVIGFSGSGKTTFLKLVEGLERGYKGKIILNGNYDLKDINKKSWREKISVVEQNIFLFDDTLKNNILLDNECSEEKINALVKMVGLETLVKRLPEGVDTKVGDDGKFLSGGERQRISIARALAKNAEIIIMDEPTSSLDNVNIEEIEKILFSLNNNIVIYITHRFDEAFLKKFDGIIIFNDGEIAEHGTYFELKDSPLMKVLMKSEDVQ